jgi:hypothetical protein
LGLEAVVRKMMGGEGWGGSCTVHERPADYWGGHGVGCSQLSKVLYLLSWLKKDVYVSIHAAILSGGSRLFGSRRWEEVLVQY